MSGAPKIKAIELVYSLERQRRGVYAGAVGRFDFADDAMDTCIALRTMVIKDGVAYIQAGGGIVFDSDENEEYEETINKAAANMRCIEQAERLHWEEQQEEAGQVNIGSVVPEEGLGEASGKVEIGGA